MSAVLTLLLAVLGFTTLNEVPKEYVMQSKDGIVFIDPAIATKYSTTEYDRVKQDVYKLQEEAYPGGLGAVIGAD